MPNAPGSRYIYALVGLLVVMFLGEMTMHFTHNTWTRWIVTLIALAATALAFAAGMRPRDLGLSRGAAAVGARYAVVIIVVVIAAIAVGLLIPPIRVLFRNDAYKHLDSALLSAFVLIPLQTVIPEELLFRGIITGTLLRRHSARFAIGVQAVLFGLWHVVSSTGLSSGNAGIGSVVGGGTAGMLLGILGAVAFTGAAGVVLGWVRWRTDSLLPSIALHWAANGAGAVAAALAWQLS
ncbi:CPBP family intramembrane glutamic endopeptidase [Jongsikchunia kroppenstedtii]|uniref:CPBP family intramembrane glutamic endopeptidase n=1 Tax=Jongsikchunia kroppenstedtii TaxID=1121721 RepID=UPI0003A99E18|nr:CPBP family intramembrane glutamic endopeptidase [Jongsikchunia kroppenstedtii]